LFERLSAIPGVVLHKPEGAFYFIAKFPVDNADHFAEWLLTSFERDGATVMLAPASGFYLTPGLGRDEVRIAYVLNESELRRAVEILAEALDRYRDAHETVSGALAAGANEEQDAFV
ncbi:MAG TPA: pyridoxal phosphate-dependent aminotransferase, partial [Thermoanaerobaculia bacterium]